MFKRLLYALLVLSWLTAACRAASPLPGLEPTRPAATAEATANATAENDPPGATQDAPPPTPPGPTPTPYPLEPIEVKLDASRAVTAAIGVAGGVLRAEAANGTVFELTIPAEAMDFTEVITLTPAAAVVNLPLSGGLAGAVSLEPAGLVFYTPAWLALTAPQGTPGPRPVAFAFDGAGAEFHLRPALVGVEAAAREGALSDDLFIEIPVPALRGYGAGGATPADIANLATQPLTDPADAFARRSVSEVFTHAGAARVEYEDRLAPAVERAAEASATGALDPATVDDLAQWVAEWLHFVQLWKLEAEFEAEMAHLRVTMVDPVLEDAARAAHARCVDQRRPEEGFRLMRWARYARAFHPRSPIAGEIEARLSKCLRFEVSFRTMMTEITDGWGWKYELHADLTLGGLGGMRSAGNAILHYDGITWLTPIADCELGGNGADSVFNATANGGGLRIEPVSRTSPAVRITFTYDPGTPTETLWVVCPHLSNEGTVQEWRTYYGQLHDYELNGTQFTAQAVVVGAGSFEGWVYHHSGYGHEGEVTEETFIDVRHTPEQ